MPTNAVVCFQTFISLCNLLILMSSCTIGLSILKQHYRLLIICIMSGQYIFAALSTQVATQVKIYHLAIDAGVSCISKDTNLPSVFYQCICGCMLKSFCVYLLYVFFVPLNSMLSRYYSAVSDCHSFFFLCLKVGPLAAYYQVPLRHILLV